jgi:hypothetical protein
VKRQESPDDELTAAEAALIISRNSKKEVKPAYLNQLVRQKRLKPRKLDARTNLYKRSEVEKIIVGARRGQSVQDHSKRRQGNRSDKEDAA